LITSVVAAHAAAAGGTKGIAARGLLLSVRLSCPAMGANADDLDQRIFGSKPRCPRGSFEGFGDRSAWALADRAATLADKKNDESITGVIMHAGDECVATLDAMHEPVLAQEIERSINRYGRQSAVPSRQALDDLIGTERIVALKQDLQHLTADWR
jgi:hypothetical protein